MRARLGLHVLALLVVFVVALPLTPLLARAEGEPGPLTILAAEEAGVGPWLLEGAMNSTGLGPYEYLYMSGELQRPAPTVGEPLAIECGWPFCGALARRIHCIEFYESRHGRFMGPNPIGLWNSVLRRYEHAAGWLGWLPSTAAKYGVQIGNRASEWNGAAAILAQGQAYARTQFYGIGAGLC